MAGHSLPVLRGSSGRGRRLRFAAGAPPLLILPVAGAGAATAALLATPRTIGLTTYGQASGIAAAADLAAGLGLVAAGLARVGRSPREPPRCRARCWPASRGSGPTGRAGRAGRRSSAASASLPRRSRWRCRSRSCSPGRGRRASLRGAIVALIALAAVVSAGRALLRDPFLDPHCWRNCTDNVFRLWTDRSIAPALEAIWVRFGLAAGGLVATLAAWRLATATRPARRILAPVLLPGVLVGAGAVAYAVALLRNPAERPDDPVFATTFLARGAAAIALAFGLAWTVLAARRTRHAVARLTARLGEAPPPGSLRTALARAAGDPDVEVAYWLPATRRYVDPAGRPVDLPKTGVRRALTPIVRDGGVVAVVAHDPGVLDASNVERTIGAAARLAVDNERLQAEALAQLHDLRASRERIVETGDAERRRLERDLHDGAQQRLLALSYELRLARAGALADGDAEAAALLATAGEQAQLALGDLRELAHGIHPAILTEAGLGPALMTLADDAPLPVEIGAVAAERQSAAVESAAYRTVVEAVQDAVRSGASHARVHVRLEHDRLLVEVRDDGAARVCSIPPVADRVGALGGRLEVESGLVRAEIPCA